MLILTRFRNEAIVIGDNIRVVVTRLNADGSVELGIDAPISIKVLREELLKGKNNQHRRQHRDDDTAD